MHEPPLQGLPWIGGKSGAYRVAGLNRWITAHLPPPDACHVYIEPFAGMLGVLLNRPPARLELANDADRAVVNWWRAVKHQPDALAGLLMRTPSARVEHEDAKAEARWHAAAWADKPLPRAGVLDWAACWTSAIAGSVGGKPGSWGRTFQIGGRVKPNRHVMAAEMVPRLADRLIHVQLECCDALEIIDRAAADPEGLIYADPPYRTVRPLYGADVDHDALETALAAARCKVAVSGYPGDRPILEAEGWTRYEMDLTTNGGGPGGMADRLECLWLNYTPPGQAELF